MFTGNKTKVWKILEKCGSTVQPTGDSLHPLIPYRRHRLKDLKNYFLLPIYRQRTIVFIMLWFCTALSTITGRKYLSIMIIISLGYYI